MSSGDEASRILYAVVARQDEHACPVLAEHALFPGNMAEVSRAILKALPVENREMTPYVYGDYMVRYTAKDGLVFLCITESLAAADTCKRFLTAIRDRFVEQIGERQWRHAVELDLNEQFGVCLRTQMDHFNSPSLITYNQLHKDVSDIKKIAQQSIDSLLVRKEKIEILVQKSEILEERSIVFRREANGLERHLCRRAWKRMVYTVVAIISAVMIAWFWECGPHLCFEQHADPHPAPSNGTLFLGRAPEDRQVEIAPPRVNSTIA
jgi:vesicle-associated membrane protein 7